MGVIGRHIQSTIETFIVQTVEKYFGANVTAETYAPSGDDSPPLPEDRIVLVQVDGTGNFAAVGVLSTTQGANPGEKILYSRNSDGEVQAAIKLLNDGKIEMISPADFSYEGENMTYTANADFSVNAENISATANSALNLTGNDVKIEGANTELTGGNVKCKGIATPDGTGCFCGVPYCLYSGAPQTGTNVSNA